MAPIEKPNAALKCFMVLAMVKLSSVNGKAVKLSSSIGKCNNWMSLLIKKTETKTHII